MGLLKPVRDPENGYRSYGTEQVDRLQQILFCREMDISLEDIPRLISVPVVERHAGEQSGLRLYGGDDPFPAIVHPRDKAPCTGLSGA